MYEIKNKSGVEQNTLESLLNEFVPYAQEALQFNKPVTIFLYSNQDNAKNPLGKTGFYSPESNAIVAYIDNRHPKDICRSIAHELVHHSQNCQGKFENVGAMEQGYAQNNKHLRKLEREAYEGDLIFRDWEDQRKTNSNYIKQLKEQKERELFSKLKKQFIKGE